MAMTILLLMLTPLLLCMSTLGSSNSSSSCRFHYQLGQPVEGTCGGHLEFERIRLELIRILQRITQLEHEAGCVNGDRHMRAPGQLYTRWGRTTCGSSTNQLYKGYVAMSKRTSNYYMGDTSRLMCLPVEPQWANYTIGDQGGASVYGAMYYLIGDQYPFLRGFNEGHSIHEHGMPCAVCLARYKKVVTMIPALKSCPSGWQEEYQGYLMGSSNAYRGVNLACVDEDPEVIPGSKLPQTGEWLFLVETVCGHLPCDVYEDGKELTCTVCSK